MGHPSEPNRDDDTARVHGVVTSLHVAERMSQPMLSPDRIEAIPGCGIRGDRYMLGTGTYSKKPEPGRQITLIEAEVLEWLAAAHGIVVAPQECRRNVVTRGIALAPLVGREIEVGTVLLRAHRITQPCRYLEKLLNQPGLYQAMWDKGGISCEILRGGIIQIGDPVRAKT